MYNTCLFWTPECLQDSKYTKRGATDSESKSSNSDTTWHDMVPYRAGRVKTNQQRRMPWKLIKLRFYKLLAAKKITGYLSMNMFNMALGTGLKGPKTLQNEALATSPEKNTAPVAAMHLPCAKPRIFERRFSFLAPAPTPPWLPVENGSCHQHEFCFLYGVAPFPPWFMIFMAKKIHFTLPQNPTKKTFRKALEQNPWPRLLTAPKDILMVALCGAVIQQFLLDVFQKLWWIF